MKTPIAMKHTGLVAAAIMVLFLSGCGIKIQTLAYGKPVPENQSAVLIIPGAYTVTNFDGESVKWTASPDFFSLSETVAEINLPSGRHNIVYSYYHYDPGMTMTEHYASGAIVQRRMFASTTTFDGNITVNMEAGKRYIFKERGIILDSNNN